MFTRPICYYLNQNRLDKKKNKKKTKRYKERPSGLLPSPRRRSFVSLSPSSHFLFSLYFWDCQTNPKENPKFLPLCSLKIMAKGWRNQRAFFLSFPQLSFFSFTPSPKLSCCLLFLPCVSRPPSLSFFTLLSLLSYPWEPTLLPIFL